MTKIDWDYSTFYKWYNTNQGQGDRSMVSFLEIKRYKKDDFKIVDFMFDRDRSVMSKINNLPSESMNLFTAWFPLGLYYFTVNKPRDKELQRVYFIFPTEKICNHFSARQKKEPSYTIADHFTFLIDDKKSKKTPVNSHITTYAPHPDTVEMGFVIPTFCYLPKKLELSKTGYQDASLFKGFKELIFRKVALDLIRRPFLSQTGGVGAEALANPKPKKKKSSVKKRRVSKKEVLTLSEELKQALSWKAILEVKVIGLKLPGQEEYSVTVCMIEDLTARQENDYGEYPNLAYSFVFKTKRPTLKRIEKEILKNIKYQKYLEGEDP